MEPLRVALIGKTGAGKSALGNTLLGEQKFFSFPGSESTTIKCEVGEGMLSDGRRIKVVDTPGLMDTEGRDVRGEITKAIAALSPGPHAFLIVLQPGRATNEEQQLLEELQDVFDDRSFLKHTVIIMTRMNELKSCGMTLDKYMEKAASKGVKKLYETCGKRIVGVENFTTDKEKEKYALQVADTVIKMGGFFSHALFQLMQDHKKEMESLRREIDRIVNERKISRCTVL